MKFVTSVSSALLFNTSWQIPQYDNIMLNQNNLLNLKEIKNETNLFMTQKHNAAEMQ